MSETTRIDEADLDYHAKLVARVRWAQQAQQEISRIDGAFRSWADHLHEKYELGPSDGVDEEGRITRGDAG